MSGLIILSENQLLSLTCKNAFLHKDIPYRILLSIQAKNVLFERHVMTTTHQPVDETYRKQAKTLLRTARHASLACIEADSGYPLASRISCTTAMDSTPVFLISKLAPHFTGLEANSRCSILIGETGKGDPLAHPRMTVFGKARKISDKTTKEIIRKRYLGKHPKASFYIDFPDFAFWQINIERASLNGGFGKACELTNTDLLTDITNCQGLVEYEAKAVAHMNEDHLDAIERYATVLLNQKNGNWTIASLDPEGMDLVNGDIVQRYWFEPSLSSAEELRPRLVELAMQTKK